MCDSQVTITFHARKSTLRAKCPLKTIRSLPICITKNHLLHFKNKLRWFRARTKFQLNFRNSFLASLHVGADLRTADGRTGSHVRVKISRYYRLPLSLTFCAPLPIHNFYLLRRPRGPIHII